MNTVCCVFLQRSCEWFLILYVAKRKRTDRVPPDALPKPQAMPLRDFFLNLNSKITNTSFPHSVSRTAAVDELVVSKAPEYSQISLFSTPVLSGSYDVWGGTRDTKPMKTEDNLHHVHFLPHRDEWDNVLCCTGKETFFITNRSQEWKFGSHRIWFGKNFS